MEKLIADLIQIALYSLVISTIAQPLIEGLLKTFEVTDKIAIKAIVFVIELWLVYFICVYILRLTVWQPLITITLFVIAGAEVINKIIKSLQDVKSSK